MDLSLIVSIIEVSNWLSSLKLLWLNTCAKIDPTGQVLATCIWVDADSLWSCGQYKDTAILWGRKRRYGKLNLFAYVYFTGYISNRSGLNSSGVKPSHRGTTILNGCKSCNGCTISYSQYHFRIFLASTITPVWVLVDDRYDIQESVIY